MSVGAVQATPIMQAATWCQCHKTFFSLSLMLWQNKLEHFSQASMWG
jgi:hypothetical protein